jgi:hypothetical protein
MTRILLGSLVCLAALACGGGAGGSGPAASKVDGTWTGTWLSVRGVGGAATMHITETGGSLSGTVTFTNSPCFASGSIDATLDAESFSATVTAGAIDVTLQGTLTDDAMSGTYDAVSAGACTGDTGTFTARR